MGKEARKGERKKRRRKEEGGEGCGKGGSELGHRKVR